jgi:FixJ family two-component response regulator
LARAQGLRVVEAEQRRSADIIATLTPRERQVLAGIAAGRLN